MRTLIDIPDQQINELAAICASHGISRAELIRRAVSSYISINRAATDDAFGIWKDNLEDGLAYQEKVRCEW